MGQASGMQTHWDIENVLDCCMEPISIESTDREITVFKLISMPENVKNCQEGAKSNH